MNINKFWMSGICNENNSNLKTTTKGPSMKINVRSNSNNVRKGGGGQSLVRIVFRSKTLIKQNQCFNNTNREEGVNSMLGLIFRWKIDILEPAVVLLLPTPTNLQHCPCSMLRWICTNTCTNSAHFVNVFMLGLGEGVKPNPNIVRIVMHIGILGRSLTDMALLCSIK
jgi:hypothetical protein